MVSWGQLWRDGVLSISASSDSKTMSRATGNQNLKHLSPPVAHLFDVLTPGSSGLDHVDAHTPHGKLV